MYQYMQHDKHERTYAYACTHTCTHTCAHTHTEGIIQTGQEMSPIGLPLGNYNSMWSHALISKGQRFPLGYAPPQFWYIPYMVCYNPPPPHSYAYDLYSLAVMKLNAHVHTHKYLLEVIHSCHSTLSNFGDC